MVTGDGWAVMAALVGGGVGIETAVVGQYVVAIVVFIDHDAVEPEGEPFPRGIAELEAVGLARGEGGVAVGVHVRHVNDVVVAVEATQDAEGEMLGGLGGGRSILVCGGRFLRLKGQRHEEQEGGEQECRKVLFFHCDRIWI